MFILIKLLYVIAGRNMNIIVNYFRSKGMKIGDNCFIYSNILTPEPYLIQLKNNITIAGEVKFITHDNSISKVFPEFSITVGSITIGNNCFLGARCMLLPGVSIGDNCIVAAGSILTKSFPDNVIIGGNPARIISDLDSYKGKIYEYGLFTDNISFIAKRDLILNSKKIINKPVIN